MKEQKAGLALNAVNTVLYYIDKVNNFSQGGQGFAMPSSECEVRNVPIWCWASELPIVDWRLRITDLQ